MAETKKEPKVRKKRTTRRTAGGAKASKITPAQELRRSVMACMLWEDEFYEDGVSISKRVQDLVSKVDPQEVREIAVEARSKMKLRHMPLFITRVMAKTKKAKNFVAATLEEVIQRADELAEFLAMYWIDGKQPISKQVKKGLAKAFRKFDAYQLAKYNRDNPIKLRDVLFLCHAKPKNKEQEALWKKLVEKTLESPDTWEVALSAGENKKEVFERLLKEKKLGAMAILRNLRNMKQAKVEKGLIKEALKNMKVERILPFRFITAAKYAPEYEAELQQAMFKCLEGHEKLPGKTILIVDVSGSMYGSRVSSKSEMDRAQAACALAILVREVCEEPVIYATAGSDSSRVHKTALVPKRQGFALSDAIYKMCNPLGGGGIFLRQVMDYVKREQTDADRIIVITDEQDCDSGSKGDPKLADAFGDNNYIINVASNSKGIAYEKFLHVNGWSEAILDYINEYEKLEIEEEEEEEKAAK